MNWTPPHLQSMVPSTIVDHTQKYQNFLCEFVNLKRNVYLHYTQALDALTSGFFSPLLRDSDKYIEDLAEKMKTSIRSK